jgi:hypothetical protein
MSESASPAAPAAGNESANNEGQADTATVDVATLTAELDKWKGLARKHEDRAKANAAAAKERDEIRQASMTEQERAVAEATAAARAEVLAEVGSTLVDAEVKTAAANLAAAGRAVDAEALLEGDALNRAAFLGEDGRPDTTKIAAWLDNVAPKATEPDQQQPTAPVWPDLGQGQRGPANKDMALNGDPLLRDLKAKLNIS